MNVKTKKAYPIYSYFEREKDYIISQKILFFMLLFMFIILILLNMKFIYKEVIEVAKAEFLLESVETTKYLEIENNNKRRLLADYSEFIIYNGYKEEKKAGGEKTGNKENKTFKAGREKGSNKTSK